MSNTQISVDIIVVQNAVWRRWVWRSSTDEKTPYDRRKFWCL